MNFSNVSSLTISEGIVSNIKSANGAVLWTSKRYDPSFSNNDWSTIIRACQNNKVPDTWVVGDQKVMTINGVDYPIDIIGIDHDDYSYGSGKAPLTFQMHNCYVTVYGMNDSSTNVGGWADCVMRNTHLPAILALMPSEVQSNIREVSKKTSEGNESSIIRTSADKLFLLSEIEVHGVTKYSAEGEGVQYAYYASGNTTAKTRDGNARSWFNRSPKIPGTASFCSIQTDGSAYVDLANYSTGVAFAFCF